MSDSFNVTNPFPRMVALALGSHGSDGNGARYLTEQLASDQEIDEAFDRLLRDLEIDRQEAKRILRRVSEQGHHLDNSQIFKL